MKLLKIESKTAVLIGVGSSICGGSAIAATAPVIDADDEDVARSISVIFLFNILAALIFPALGHSIGLGTEGFAVFAGTAVNDTSSVTAAASTAENLYHTSGILSAAVTVKLTRTLAIIPITLALALYRTVKAKKNGNYNIIKIDENYTPAPLEHKQVFGVTFEQGRQELPIDDELLSNIVTENKEIPEEALIDMKISLIVLKYTQSNSVCFVKDGQAIGIGAGQQSRVHCTRLAGQKADNWWLRQCPKVMNLPFKEKIRRADRDNAIDLYIGDEYMDVLADGAWENIFTEKPEVFTKEEKREWLDKLTDVTLGSDAFFPFFDNIERAHKSGVKYIAQPGGSVRDDAVIDCCNKYNMAMAFTGIRLFHH